MEAESKALLKQLKHQMPNEWKSTYYEFLTRNQNNDDLFSLYKFGEENRRKLYGSDGARRLKGKRGDVYLPKGETGLRGPLDANGNPPLSEQTQRPLSCRNIRSTPRGVVYLTSEKTGLREPLDANGNLPLSEQAQEPLSRRNTRPTLEKKNLQ